MAVSWTTITNAQVAAGAPLTTSLVTALRDNPEGIAQRASGALKAFNVPYNYQEFTTINGTWIKPADAETGDEVFVELCAGGQAGDGAFGGRGGTGMLCRFDIDDLGATEPVVVGLGGTSSGQAGGDSSFGTDLDSSYRKVVGGTAGAGAQVSVGSAADEQDFRVGESSTGVQLYGGIPDTSAAGSSPGGSANTIWGGGAGGPGTVGGVVGGNSCYHGRGGFGISGAAGQDGEFPGGGGGGSSISFGIGGSGVVRVYCIKRI